MPESNIVDQQRASRDHRQLLNSTQGELLERSPLEAANADPLASAARYFNVVSEFPKLIEVPSDDWMMRQLRNRCASDDATLWAAPPERKIAALSGFSDGFLATQEQRQFAISLTAAIAECAELKSAECPRYRRLLHRLPFVLNGGAFLPSRQSADLLTGRNFVLMGVAKVGRSAFLARLRKTYGLPYRVEPHIATAPGQVWYFPTMYVRWPRSNNIEGFVESIRDVIAAEVKDPTSEERVVLHSLKGRNAVAAATAACVLFNVGLLIIDGAVADHVGGDFEGILDFAARLKDYGVPVLLSCSEAFLRRASYSNPEIVNAFAGQVTTFSPVPGPPDEAAMDADGNLLMTLWETYCLFFWSQGIFCDARYPMPKALPVWTYRICLGRVGWLSAGFQALHKHLVWNPDSIENLTEGVISAIFEEQLFHYGDARRVIRAAMEHEQITESEFLRFMDHLPGNAADLLRFTSALKMTGRSRGGH